jgi:PIN domain nuclease of toxin-antitoxin system
MNYLLDTVTITRYFSRKGKISHRAKRIIEQAEDFGSHKLFVSVVSLFEIIYLFERERIGVSLPMTISMIESKSCYQVIDLTIPIVVVAKDISFYEMHDRLILATAAHLRVPIVSSDEKFDDVKEVQRIW